MPVLMAICFIMITVPGKPTSQFAEPMPLEDCFKEVRNIMEAAPRTMRDGGVVQAGCVLEVPPSKEAGQDAGEKPLDKSRLLAR